MKSTVIAVLMCVLGIGLALAATETKPATTTEPEVTVYREVGGQQLHLYISHPEKTEPPKPAPAILLFHGGGWVWGKAQWTNAAAKRYAELGMVAISVEYRLTNENVTPVDALTDTRAAFHWVRQHADKLNIDPNRVAGYGVSAGGHLVTAAATVPDEQMKGEVSSRPDLLLLWSPALDVVNDGWFRKLLRGKADPADYSPAGLAGKGTPPTCIVHGDKDTLTPLKGVLQFAKRVRESGGTCELNIYENVGHLLTRNLDNQEDDFDPDPEKRADGIEKLNQFLRKQGYIE